MRHQKVHNTDELARSELFLPSPQGKEGQAASEVAESSKVQNHTSVESNVFPSLEQTLPFEMPEGSVDFLPDTMQLSDADLRLIWPDSEELFNSLFSVDFAEPWLPLGTLPLPSAGDIAGEAAPGAPCQSDGSKPLSTAQPGDTHRAVNGVSQMVSSYTSSLTTAVEARSITSVFLDESLHMFFDRFIPIMPIMHRPTFIHKDCSHHLLLNAIAIGTLYLGPDDSVAKGEALWRLAHTAIATSWQSLIAHRGPYDACSGVQLVLSALLSVVYGALSQNSAIRAASQALHSSAFFWARQCGMFECEPFKLEDQPFSTNFEAHKLLQWRKWAAREIQQRALASHYILDGLIAHFRGNPTSVRHTSNTLSMPGSEVDFQISSVDQWWKKQGQTVSQAPVTFIAVYKQFFVPSGHVPIPNQQCSAFSLRVLLEGLQSMIADSDPVSGAILNPPTASQISQALLWVHERIEDCAESSEVERLELMLRWHAVCLESVANTPQLCKFVCKRWDVQQNLWPNENLREQDFDLPEFADSADGRRALLHAVAIQDIVERIPRGRAHVIHMPSSLFAAATIYAAFVFAGDSKVQLRKDVVWKEVLLHSADGLSEAVTSTQGPQDHLDGISESLTSKNIVYEFNAIQKLCSCLGGQWGVSYDMEKVVRQWMSLCRL